MKKLEYLLLFFLSLFGTNTFGQITIDSSDLYVAPDTINVVKTTNAGALNIKTSGQQTWDFRALKADSVQQIILRKLDGANPVDNKFQSAEMVLERPGEGNAYLVLTKDSLVVDGIADFRFDASITADVDLDPDLKLMQLPINYQDSFSTFAVIDSTIDSIVRVGPVPVFDSIRVQAELDQRTKCDGYGNLLTVQTTFNTIRLKTIEKQTVKVYGHQISNGQWTELTQFQTITITNRYTWLAKNRGYQVAEVTTDELDQNILTAQYTLIDSLFGYVDNQNNPNCYGESNGSANFLPVVGSGFYSFQWSASAGSQQTRTATGLEAGKHIITVTDIKTNQTFVDTVELVNPDSLIAKIDGFTNESDSGKDGKIEVSVSGGTPPYNFTWDKSNSNIGIAENLEGGEHTVTVKDSKGCTRVLKQTLSSAVGIKNIASNNISVYPNPATNKLYVKRVDTKLEVLIIDVTGKLIQHDSVDSTTPIDISELESGVYFTTLRDEATGINQTIRLIVE